MSGSPLSQLSAAGEQARLILPLTWFTIAISVSVCVVIGVLLYLGVRRARPLVGAIRDVPLEMGRSGVHWITRGLMISAVPLLAILIWTLKVLGAAAATPAAPDLLLDVTAHQYWWEVHYTEAQPADSFVTANEIHIPVGAHVLVRLHAGDVIHSFWVPQLAGKTDLIPEQTNQAWLRALSPGRYLGQCAEFCGYQHAHMQFEVVAETPAQFEAWRTAQRREAAAPSSEAARRGLQLVEYRCGLCHRVGGTQAQAVSGPDLTHLMARRTLAAGTLVNTPGNLLGWIDDPQDLKPGSLMPNQNLSAQQLSDALAYLETLR